MRQYLKVDEKWKDWENLEMQWIHHHNPDLVVLDAAGGEALRTGYANDDALSAVVADVAG